MKDPLEAISKDGLERHLKRQYFEGKYLAKLLYVGFAECGLVYGSEGVLFDTLFGVRRGLYRTDEFVGQADVGKQVIAAPREPGSAHHAAEGKSGFRVV